MFNHISIRKKIIIANVGDSRCIIVKVDKAIQFSIEQQYNNEHKTYKSIILDFNN